MKITFDDKSSIEIRHADKPDHLLVIISAADATNKNKRVTNACELTLEEFSKLISDIQSNG